MIMVANKCVVTRSIVGLKKEESDSLLGFLLNHVGHGIDYQVRVRWAPRTVVVWDVSSSYCCKNFISIFSKHKRLTVHSEPHHCTLGHP